MVYIHIAAMPLLEATWFPFHSPYSLHTGVSVQPFLACHTASLCHTAHSTPHISHQDPHGASLRLSLSTPTLGARPIAGTTPVAHRSIQSTPQRLCTIS